MNLLLIEDSLATRKLLATLVQNTGEKHQVFEAGSAEEAIEVLGPDNAPGMDLFLVDQHLPGMDGATLVRHIRERFGSGSAYRPYIIMVTSDELETTIERCLDAGANDYITKPVNLKVLEIRLRVARVLCEIGRAAHESEYLRALALGAFNTAVIPMAICDAAPGPVPFVISFANRAMAQLLGCGQPDLSGRSLPALQGWAPEYAGRARAAVAATTCFTEPLESSSPRFSGASLFCSLVPLNVQQGSPTHVLVMQAAGG